MALFQCKVKCFYNGKVYEVGEVYTAQDKEAVPSHFVEINKPIEKPKKDKVKGEPLSSFTPKKARGYAMKKDDGTTGFFS